MTPRDWTPTRLFRPEAVLQCPHSAWEGLERGLGMLLHDFRAGSRLAVEFGTERGYSAVALSNYFERVVTVDPLLQREPNGELMSWTTGQRLRPYQNVVLCREGWQAWADGWDGSAIDCIHIDIDPHDYDMTLAAGTWAAQHAPLVLFHDTHNGTAIEMGLTRALGDIAEREGMEWWDWAKDFGLGILWRPCGAKEAT